MPRSSFWYSERMRAVIYARYSSDRQSESSIEDQLELCRRVIDREGWVLTRAYEDRAISGAVRQRPAFQQLLADAESGGFDVVVTESLDRLGRKLADVADASASAASASSPTPPAR